MFCKQINIRKILIRLLNNIRILVTCRSNCCNLSIETITNTIPPLVELEETEKVKIIKRKLPTLPKNI